MSADILYDEKLSRYYLPVLNECRKIADRVLKIRYSRGRLIGVDALQNEYAYAEFIGKDNPEITREMRLYAELLSDPEDTYGRAFYGPDRKGVNPEAAATAFYEEHKQFLVDNLGSKIFEYICLPYASIESFATYSDESKYRPMDEPAIYDENDDIEEEPFYQTDTNERLAALFVSNPIEDLANRVCSDDYLCKSLSFSTTEDVSLNELFIHVLNESYARSLWYTENQEGIVIFTERLRKLAESYEGEGTTITEFISLFTSNKNFSPPTHVLKELIDTDKFGLFIHMFLHTDRAAFFTKNNFKDAIDGFYSFASYLMLLNLRCFENLLFEGIRSVKTQKEGDGPDDSVVIAPVDVANPVRQTILQEYANIEDITSNFDTYFTAMLQVCAKATSDTVIRFIKDEQMLTSKAADFITALTDNNNPLVHAIIGKEVSVDERIATSLMGAEDNRVFSTAKEVFSEGRDCPIHFVLKDLSLEPEYFSEGTVYTNLEIYAEYALTTISEMLDNSPAAIVPILTCKLGLNNYSTPQALDIINFARYLLNKVDNSQVAKLVPFIQYNVFNYKKTNHSEAADIVLNTSLPDNVAIYFGLRIPEDDDNLNELPQFTVNNIGKLNIHLIRGASSMRFISPQERRDFALLRLFGRRFPIEEPPRLTRLFGIYNIKKYAQSSIGYPFKKQAMLFSAKAAILKDLNFIEGLAEGAKIITNITTLIIPVNDKDKLVEIMGEYFWDENIEAANYRGMRGEIDVALILGSHSLGLKELNSDEHETYGALFKIATRKSKNIDILANLYTVTACKHGVVKDFIVKTNSEETSLFKQAASGINMDAFELTNLSHEDAWLSLHAYLHVNHILYGTGFWSGRPVYPFAVMPDMLLNNLALENEEYTEEGVTLRGLFNFTTMGKESSYGKTLISLKERDFSRAPSLYELYRFTQDEDEKSRVNSLLSQLGLAPKKGKLLLEKGASGLASIYAFLFYNYLSCRCDEHFIDVFKINTMSSLVDALEMTNEKNKEYGYSFQKLERAFANNIPFVLGYRHSASTARVPTAENYIASGTNLSIPKLLFSMTDFYTRPVAILEDILYMREGRSNPFVRGESVISGVLHNTGDRLISLYTDALKRSQLDYEEWSISQQFEQYGDRLSDVPLEMLDEEISRFYKSATVLEYDIIADMLLWKGDIYDTRSSLDLTNKNAILNCALQYKWLHEEELIDDDAIEAAVINKGFTEKDFPKWEVNTEYFNSFSSSIFDAFEDFTSGNAKRGSKQVFNINKAEAYEISPFEHKLHIFLRYFCEALLPYSDLYQQVYNYIQDPQTYDSSFFNDINPQSKEIPKLIEILSNPDFPKTRAYTAIAKPKRFGDDLTTEVATKNSGVSYALLSNVFSGTLKPFVSKALASEKKKRLLAHELLGALALLEASRSEIYKVKAKPEEYGDIIYENESGYKLIQTHTADGKLDKFDGIYERAKLLTQDHGGICIGQGEYYSRDAADGNLQIFTIMSPDTILAVVGVNPKSNHPDEIKAYRNKTPAGLLPSERDYKKASKENILTTTKFVVDILKANYEKRDVPPQTTYDLDKLIIAAAYHMGIEEDVEDFDRFLAELITGVYDEELNKYGDYYAIKGKVV